MALSSARRSRRTGLDRPSRRRIRSARPTLEAVEERVLLTGFTPAQIQQAYGINRLSFDHGSIPADGRGYGAIPAQTIAILAPLNDPNIVSDVNTFSQAYGLPLFNQGGPTLQVVQPDGAPVSAIPSAPKGPNGWAVGTSMDVEWAHAVAPRANILLVEVPVFLYADGSIDMVPMYPAAQWAAAQPGVSVVSIGFGTTDTATTYDDNYLSGGTFVASAGPSGEVQYPASSPNVIGVGGTYLTIDASGNYLGETAYNYTPGTEDPNFTKTTPDVAYAETGNEGGYSFYDSWDNGSGSAGWSVRSLTDNGASQWAALIAIADQGYELAVAGMPPLSGSRILAMLHTSNAQMPGFDFHQAGLPVGSYEMGSPIATRVVYGLMQEPITLPLTDDLVPGVAFTGTVATFEDFSGPVLQGPWAAEIDWGDDAEGSGEVISAGNGVYDVIGTNVYESPGVYPIMVSISGDWINGAEQVHGVAAVSPLYAQGTTGTNELFVEGLYEDFLGRQADAGGLAYWTGQVPVIGRAAVASGIARSTEAFDDDVTHFYETFLGRAPDAGGLSYWVSQLQQGQAEESVMSGILGSGEFLNDAIARVGSPSGASVDFVEALYQEVLKRQPATSEVNGWVSVLASLGGINDQAARTQVALDFVSSAEFRTDAVESLYGSVYQYSATPYGPQPPAVFQTFVPDLLDRYWWVGGPGSGASTAEVNGWVNSGEDLLTMEVAFAASAEFYAVPRA